MSYAAADQGDPHTAWQLAHTAVSHAEPDVRAQVWTDIRAAQEAAGLGDSGAALAELKLALNFGSEHGSSRARGRRGALEPLVDRASIWAVASSVYTRLGAADDAYAAAVRALDSPSGSKEGYAERLAQAEI